MTDWQPTATPTALQARAALYARIRAFFAGRQVLEVETPVLSHAAVSDPYLNPLYTQVNQPGVGEHRLFLHTSPEYPMKRLLAAGSGCIYQLCKVFRNDESGRLHNPEFTLLEWYRLGFDDRALMTEIEALLQVAFQRPELQVERRSYGALFQQHLGVNPHQATAAQLAELATRELDISGAVEEVSDWLNLLFSHLIEPQLQQPTFVYDYPACQAALARIADDGEGQPVAKRFELFMQGTELANGYQELTDGDEQARRFHADQQRRQTLGLAVLPTDQHLVEALAAGLPDCAGVALGVDRLLMLVTGADSIHSVLAFPLERA